MGREEKCLGIVVSWRKQAVGGGGGEVALSPALQTLLSGCLGVGSNTMELSWVKLALPVFFLLQEGSIAYSTDRATPQQYACSTPNSELDHVSQYEVAGAGPEGLSSLDNPLLASLLPGTRHPVQSVQLMPSGGCSPFCRQNLGRLSLTEGRAGVVGESSNCAPCPGHAIAKPWICVNGADP